MRVVLLIFLLFVGPCVFAQGSVKYDAFGRVLEDSGHVAPVAANPLKPHSSIDKRMLAAQYSKNKSLWDSAFSYLRETDLNALSPGKFAVGRLIVMVSEGKPRKIDTTKWEGHLRYADIQYVFRGREKIGRAVIAALSPATAYDSVRDIRFYTGNGKYFVAEAGVYFIFFPGEGHRPNLQIDDGEDKKIVVKLPVVE